VIDRRERAVVELWRKGRLTPGMIVIYLQWVRRFRTYCDSGNYAKPNKLTAVGARRFAKMYAGPRLKGRQSSKESATSLAMRSMRGLARWRRWVRRCRRGAINMRRRSHRYWRSTAIIGVSTMGYRKGRWCAMSRPRVLPRATAQWKDTTARARLTDVDAFVRMLSSRLRDGQSRIPAVRFEGYSDSCGWMEG